MLPWIRFIHGWVGIGLVNPLNVLIDTQRLLRASYCLGYKSYLSGFLPFNLQSLTSTSSEAKTVELYC